ncbi:hypothetical protein PC121_g5392 [Phytophthora cactorum]|nr:hypothetical protein PC121_g5392 [Phytophthora cactorum]
MKMEKEEAIQVREKADTGRQRKKPPVTKRRYSPCEPSPPPSKKTKKDREVRCGGERQYEPRRRKSWLLDELKPMKSEEDTIVNVVALFRPSVAIRTWDDFNKHFDIYKKKHNLKFRVRSSERTVLYNTTHPD